MSRCVLLMVINWSYVLFSLHCTLYLAFLMEINGVLRGTEGKAITRSIDSTRIMKKSYPLKRWSYSTTMIAWHTTCFGLGRTFFIGTRSFFFLFFNINSRVAYQAGTGFTGISYIATDTEGFSYRSLSFLCRLLDKSATASSL